MKNNFHLLPSLLIMFLLFSPFSTQANPKSNYTSQPKFELLKNSDNVQAKSLGNEFCQKLEMIGATVLGLGISSWAVFVLIIGLAIRNLIKTESSIEVEKIIHTK